MITIKNGNILDSNTDIIAHQVNCQGRMGSGVALAIANEFPLNKERYLIYCSEKEDSKDLLGSLLLVKDKDSKEKIRIIANLFGQHNYGYDGGQYTIHTYLITSFKHLAYQAGLAGFSVAMPYKIGCGLGGGNWSIIYTAIEEIFHCVDVELWRLED